MAYQLQVEDVFPRCEFCDGGRTAHSEYEHSGTRRMAMSHQSPCADRRTRQFFYATPPCDESAVKIAQTVSLGTSHIRRALELPLCVLTLPTSNLFADVPIVHAPGSNPTEDQRGVKADARGAPLCERAGRVEGGVQRVCAGTRTRNGKITMRWTKKGYAFGVVCRGRHKLVGWPWYANIPFTNLSSIPGGQPTIRCLLVAWRLGILRFEPATEEEIDLARRNPEAVLPGAPPPQSAPFCWGPFGTNQMRKAKKNGVSLPLKKPKRGKRTGPISPKLVLDSDVDDSDEVRSDDE